MVIEVKIVVTAILGFMAVLAAWVSLALRRDSALLWASGCFLCATAQNLTIYYASGSSLEAVSSIIVATIAFWFANQTVCALTGEWRNRALFNLPFFGLLAIAVSMLAAGGSIQVPAFTAELARLAAVVDACWRLAQNRCGRPIQTFLFGAFLILVVSRVARLFLLSRQPDVDFQAINNSQDEVALAFGESLLAIFVIIFMIADLLWRTIRELRDKSEKDSLTGLLNRRGLTTIAEKLSPTGGAVIYCDIDHFKSINDRFGHEVGDTIIVSVGAILADVGRPTGRIGGEEFAIIVEGASLSAAALLAESMRLRITQTHHAKGSDMVTASFGVAIFNAGFPSQSAFKAADHALYRAKREGRNKVAVEAETNTSLAEV